MKQVNKVALGIVSLMLTVGSASASETTENSKSGNDPGGFPMPEIVDPVTAAEKSACGVAGDLYGTLSSEGVSGLQVAEIVQADSGTESTQEAGDSD